MTDTSNPFAGMGSYFFANDPQGSANLKLREKIALAMMMKKSAAPKNLGEGLSSAGDSIFDAIAARNLENQDRLAQATAMGAKTPDVETATAPTAAGPSPVQAASIASGEPSTTMTPPAAPAVPAPPDVPGAVRMSTPQQLADFRGQNPLPTFRPPQGTIGRAPVGDETGPPSQAMPSPMPPPGAPPPGLPPQAPQRPSVADFGQKPALAPTPPPGSPVMAQGPDPTSLPMAPPDDPRRAIALAMMRQQMGNQPGQPSQAPPPPAAPAPDQGIRTAPPAVAPIQKAPAPQDQTAYVPPDPGTPQGAPIIAPSPREMTLRASVNRLSLNNPYAAQSPDAIELSRLEKARELRQTEANELFKSRITQANEQAGLRQKGLMDERSRALANQRAGIEVGDLPTKLQQESEQRTQTLQKGRQEMIAEQPAAQLALPPGARDPRLGTPDSPQRAGPRVPPMPGGGIPKAWAEGQQKKIEADTLSLESSKPALRETIDLINQARNHVAKEYSVGTGGTIAQMTQRGQGFKAIMDQLSGQNLVAAYQKIKGTGPVGQQEGENVAKSGARITTAQGKEDFDNAMDDLEKSLRGNVERNERQLNQPVTAYQRTPNDPYAPDIGQTGTRGGKLVEYIGGDPSDNRSYRAVRR